MASILENIAEGAGVGVVKAGVEQAFGQYNASQDYHRQQKLMDKQYKLNQAGQKNAAMNTVEGMRMAGLNPALAQGQVQTGSTVGLGSSSQAYKPNVDIDPVSMSQMNINTETEKGLSLENDAKIAENMSFMNGLIDGYIKQVDILKEEIEKNPKDKEDLEKEQARLEGQIENLKEMLDKQDKMANVGLGRGMKAAADASKSSMDVMGNVIKGKLENKVNYNKLKSDTCLFALINTDVEVFNNLIKVGKKIDAEVGGINANTKLTKAQTNQVVQVMKQGIANDPKLLLYMANEAKDEGEKKVLDQLYRNWLTLDEYEKETELLKAMSGANVVTKLVQSLMNVIVRETGKDNAKRLRNQNQGNGVQQMRK